MNQVNEKGVTIQYEQVKHKTTIFELSERKWNNLMRKSKTPTFKITRMKMKEQFNMKNQKKNIQIA